MSISHSETTQGHFQTSLWSVAKSLLTMEATDHYWIMDLCNMQVTKVELAKTGTPHQVSGVGTEVICLSPLPAPHFLWKGKQGGQVRADPQQYQETWWPSPDLLSWEALHGGSEQEPSEWQIDCSFPQFSAPPLQDRAHSRGDARHCGIQWQEDTPMTLINEGLKVKRIYVDIPKNEAMPWIDKYYPRKQYVWQQDSAPSHKARIVQKWCAEKVRGFWPPRSPNLNPFNFTVWSVLQSETCDTPIQTLCSWRPPSCRREIPYPRTTSMLHLLSSGLPWSHHCCRQWPHWVKLNRSILSSIQNVLMWLKRIQNAVLEVIHCDQNAAI